MFFGIFSGLFLLELDAGVGEDFDGASGTAKFFRMSCGGAAIGLFFGLGLILLLHILNRQLSREENVLQVAATITIAYLCYYTVRTWNPTPHPRHDFCPFISLPYIFLFVG